jgi:hypothetical protein
MHVESCLKMYVNERSARQSQCLHTTFCSEAVKIGEHEPEQEIGCLMRRRSLRKVTIPERCYAVVR